MGGNEGPVVGAQLLKNICEPHFAQRTRAFGCFGALATIAPPHLHFPNSFVLAMAARACSIARSVSVSMPVGCEQARSRSRASRNSRFTRLNSNSHFTLFVRSSDSRSASFIQSWRVHSGTGNSVVSPLSPLWPTLSVAFIVYSCSFSWLPISLKAKVVRCSLCSFWCSLSAFRPAAFFAVLSGRLGLRVAFRLAASPTDFG